MKRTMLLLAAGAVLPFVAPAAVTYDFTRESAELFGSSAAGVGTDLLSGVTWTKNARLSTNAVVPDDPRRQLVKTAVRHEELGAERRIENTEELRSICKDDNLARSVVGAWDAGIPLPDAQGGRYRLSFKYAMRHTLGEHGSVFILIYSGQKTVGRVVEYLANIDSDDFSFVKEFEAPVGADRLYLIVRVDGVGALRFWNPSLVRAPAEKPVVLHQAAQGFFDSRFEISEGQPGLVNWMWKRGYGSTADNNDLFCRLTVPKGFVLEGLSFADVAKPVSKKEHPDGSVEYLLSPAHWLRPKAAFSSWHRLGAMLTSPNGVGTKGRLTLQVEKKDGTVLSDVSSVDLVVTERISAPMPRRFVGGVTPSGCDWVCGPVCTARFAAFLAETGTAGFFLHSGPDAALTGAFKRAGVREVLRGSSQLTNGFCIGPEKGRPEDEKYVFLNPGHMYEKRSACPVSVYTESDFFKTVTVPWLKSQFSDGVDAFWTNWEPYSYAGKGCMCDKCRAAFAKYVGVSDAEMAKDWPKELVRGGKWGDRIERFRSLEHAKLVKTLAKNGNIIFGIAWCEMSSAWRPRNLAAEVQAIDYASAVKTMSPWGPYVYWDTTSPYPAGDGKALVTFCAAKDVRATVDGDYPDGKRPRLMGFPSGCSYGTDWVAQPEWIEIQQASFFFNGWESSYPAGFPRGYDARYWRAFARANALAARYEDFVYDGMRVDADYAVRPAKGQKPFKTQDNVSAYLDWTKKGVSLVQHVAYRKGGQTIVAVFNFSDTDDVRVDVVSGGRTVRTDFAVPACSCRVVELGEAASAALAPGKVYFATGTRKQIEAAGESAYRMGIEYASVPEKDLSDFRDDFAKFSSRRTQKLLDAADTQRLAGRPRYLDFSDAKARASELARAIAADAPVLPLASAPSVYYGSDAFWFVKELPTTWDETRHLANGLVARRKGDDWYLARTGDGKASTLAIDLGFMGHGRRHLTAYGVRREDRVVSLSETVLFETASDGGFAARLVRPVTLFIAGDSTTAHCTDAKPYGSWAEALVPFFAPDVRLANCAVGGRSTKSFRAHWDHDIRPYLKKGDRVLIQFATNDAVTNQPYRSCTPDEYAANLRTYVAETRAAGAEALLVSCLSHRLWNDDGTWTEKFYLEPYTAAMAAVAAELKVPYVDMTEPTGKLVKELGCEGSRKLFGVYNGKTDNIHPSKAGAKAFAKLFVRAVRDAAGHPARTLFAYARDLSKARIVAADAGSEAVAELKVHLAAKAGTTVDASAPLSFVFGKPDDALAARPFESRYRIDGDTVWFWGDDGGPDAIWDWGDDRGRESQRRRGTQFAVERFARERLGMDWVWPEPDGTVVKPSKRVVWPIRADGVFETALEKGRIRNYEAYTPYTRKDVAGLMPEGLYSEESDYPITYQGRWTWQRRQCLQDRSFFTYGHAFTDWYARFFETHPEYLNRHAADGTRGWSGSAKKNAVKLCVSNPAVADQVVADWLANGTNRYFNVCENDGTCWCECEACRALDVPQSSAEDVCANKVQLSDRYVTFWNRIAEKARAIRPDVQLVSYVYSAYRFPPRRVKIAYPENLVCGFVSNEQEDATEMVRAWQAAGMRRFFFRPNHLHYMGTIHRGYERQFYREFHDLLRLGMIGCDYDAGVNRATVAIEFYVLARTIADPALGFEEIVRDYYAAYGAAAEEVRAYYEAVRATGEAAREAAMRAKRDQGEFFDQARTDVPKTQELGRDEAELTAKKAMLDAAVRCHEAANDLTDVEMRRLRNLALQAEHGLLTYRFLVAVTDLPLDELKARAKALNDFRVAHKDDLPDLYTKVYRIWWGEVRYWKVYNRRVAQGK